MPAWWLDRDSDPAAVREACTFGSHCGPTAGLADGFVQANLVIVPAEHAGLFREFCRRNPRPCPLLEELPPGERLTRVLAGRHVPADLATCLPRYRVWRNGSVAEEVTDLRAMWRDDFCAFLLGCSFSFEQGLEAAGIRMRHTEERKNVPMYITSRPCESAGPFRGNLVVSMRPLLPGDVPRATAITRRFPRVHGAPVHVGEPAALGIADLDRPDFGDAVSLRPGEVPCFWACGVTSQLALQAAALPLAVTHAPVHMFVADLRNEALAEPGQAPAGRRGTTALLIAVLVAVAAMAAGVAWEEWRAGVGGAGGAAAGGAVAGQSLGWRVLWRLFDPTWLRLPAVGAVA